MRISELADSVGVPTSTVRYYERVGLLDLPARTTSGYRDYGEDAAARLLFIARARRMGLSCEQITALIPVWDGTNCGEAHDRVGQLIEEKQAEIAQRMTELAQFAAQLQLDGVDARGLVGEREHDELGVVVDVGVVAGPDVVGVPGRDDVGLSVGVAHRHLALQAVAPVWLLAGTAGELGEPLRCVEAGAPTLEGDRHAARLRAVLVAGALDVNGQLGVVAGEGSHGPAPVSGTDGFGRHPERRC